MENGTPYPSGARFGVRAFVEPLSLSEKETGPDSRRAQFEPRKVRCRSMCSLDHDQTESDEGEGRGTDQRGHATVERGRVHSARRLLRSRKCLPAMSARRRRHPG